MPEPVTFEEAVQRVRDANPHLNHAQALHYLSDLYSQGDPEVHAIPDIRGKLSNSALSSFVDNAAAGVAETIGVPLGGLSSMLAAHTDPKGQVHQTAERFSNVMEKGPEAVTENDMPGLAGKVGRFIGQGAGLTGIVEGSGIGAAGRALPWIGDVAGKATPLVKQMARGAGENLALQKLGALGNMSPGDAIFFGGAIPAVFRGAGKLGEIFGLTGGDAAVKVPSASEPPTGPTSIEPEPKVAAEAAKVEPNPNGLGVQKGQPFSTMTHTRTRSNVSGVDIFAPQDHPIYGKGQAYPRNFNKPLVVDVPSAGPEGWQHAATSLYANNPRIVQRISDATDPEGFSQLLVARAAKKAGHDSVSLATPDVADNVIMDLQDVTLKQLNATKHPDLTGDLFRFQSKAADSANNDLKGVKLRLRGTVEEWGEKPQKGEISKIDYRDFYKQVFGEEPSDKELAEFRDLKGPKGSDPFDQPRPAAGRQIPQGDEHLDPIATLIDGSKVKLNRWGPGGPGYHADGTYLAKDGTILDPKVVKSVQWPKGSQRVHASGDPALAKKISAQMAEMAKSVSKDDPDILDHLHKQGLLIDNISVFQPETQDAIEHVNTRGRAWRFLPVRWLSNRPAFNRGFQSTMEAQFDSNAAARQWRITYEGLRKEYPELRDPAHFDEITRAVDGLRYEPETGYKSLKQTALNISARHNEIAQELSKLRDGGYTFLTGIDPRVPYILERSGLSHNRWQLERLKAMQDPQQLAVMENSKAPPTENEYLPAADSKGMLNFNFTHDLDFEPITGWMRFHPHDNEKAMIEDAISHLTKLREVQKDVPFEDQLRLEELLKRNKELTEADWKRQMARSPITDFIPKRKWVSMLHKEGHPAFYSKDPDQVMAMWTTGITNKRIADVNLAHVRNLLKDESIPGPEKDLYTEWANSVRGATGYRADARTADFINSFMPHDHQLTAHDIHRTASTIMEWNSLTKLHISQIRFPIINLTHLFVTALPTAGFKYFGIGMKRTLANPQRAIKEALEAGVISHDSEWFKEIGDVESSLGKAGRPIRYTAWLSENFRKAAAYQVGKAMAEDGQFSPVIEGFVKDEKAYSNLVQRNKAYARQFVSATQFELGRVDKPLAFSGGGAKRVITQFRSWQSNLTGLYMSMWRHDKAAFGKGIIALGMLGGVRAAWPLPGTYDAIRAGLLKAGVVNLPQRPGFHYALKLLGLQDTPPDMIDIQSFRDPFAMAPYNMVSLLGPTVSSLWDLGANVSRDLDDGTTYKIPKDALRGLAPQVEDAVEGAQEILSGGVVGKDGVIDKNRTMLSKIFRGIDLQQSLPAQQSQYEHDLEQAILGGNSSVIQSVRTDYEHRGIHLAPGAGRRIKAYQMKHARAGAHKFAWSDL